MQVTEKSTTELKKEFDVVISFEDVKKRLKSRLEKLNDDISLPGFRKGKVPISLLKSRYEKKILHEVIEAMIKESSLKIIEDKKLQIVTHPKCHVTSYKEESGLQYNMKFEILPEVVVPDFSKLEFDRLKVVVDKPQINKVIKQIIDSNDKKEVTSESDAVVESGDTVIVDINVYSNDVLLKESSKENFSMIIGSAVIDPSLDNKLISSKIGQKQKLNIKSKDDKLFLYEVNVKRLFKPMKFKEDNVFAKHIGYENTDDMRKDITNKLQHDHDMKSYLCLKRNILDSLSDELDFSVPESMVENEIDTMVEQFKKNSNEKLDDKKLRDDCVKVSERRVRLGLLFSQIGKLNNIFVSKKELDDAILKQANQYPGQEKNIIDFFENNEHAKSNLKVPLYEAKIIDFIISKAKISEKEVSLEELNKVWKKVSDGNLKLNS